MILSDNKYVGFAYMSYYISCHVELKRFKVCSGVSKGANLEVLNINCIKHDTVCICLNNPNIFCIFTYKIEPKINIHCLRVCCFTL